MQKGSILASKAQPHMYRTTNVPMASSGSVVSEILRRISLDDGDSDSQNCEELSLGASFDFILKSFSCSEIGEIGPIEKSIRRRYSEEHSSEQWTNMYANIVQDIQLALAPALVPVVHTQAQSRSETPISSDLRAVGSSDSGSKPPFRFEGRSMTGDDEYRFAASPLRKEDFGLSSLSPLLSPPLSKSLIMRDEDIPEMDGTEIVITRSATSKLRRDPFVTEFYRSSVAPLLE